MAPTILDYLKAYILPLPLFVGSLFCKWIQYASGALMVQGNWKQSQSLSAICIGLTL